MDRTSPTLGDAAAKFRAGETDGFPNNPEQRRRRIDVKIMGRAINGKTDHCKARIGAVAGSITVLNGSLGGKKQTRLQSTCSISRDSRYDPPNCIVEVSRLIKKTLRNLRGILIYGGCTVNTIFWFVPLMVLAILKLMLPIKSLQNMLTRRIMAIGEIWIDINAFLFSLVNSTEWDVRGAEGLDPNRWYLVIVNHQTWVDIVALQTVLNRRIPFLKFFIKQQLIWFPFLGIAWWAMDMPFMKRYSKSYLAKHPEKKGKDLQATRKSCEKFRDTPTTVINFVEGTRFTDEKKKRRASPLWQFVATASGWCSTGAGLDGGNV